MELWAAIVGSVVLGFAAAILWGRYLAKRNGCDHLWCERPVKDVLYRKCMKCEATEVFSPDVSGWTAGNWDRIDKGQAR